MRKINIDDVAERELVIQRSGEKLTLAKSLSDAFNLEGLLVHQEVLLPGRRASSFHFHSDKEEVYVLAGTPTILIGDWMTELEPGDFVGFTPTDKTPHMLLNRSPEPATVLTIAACFSTDEVTYVDQDLFNPLPVGRG